jgi:tetratricopeptide (TPR) repeat protein
VRPIPDKRSAVFCFFLAAPRLHVFWSLAASISLLLAVCASNSASCQTSEDQIAEHFRAGQVALKQGEFVRATEEFKKVLALDPALFEAEVNLGLAYHSASEYELAVRHLSKALQQRPNLLAPNVIVGMDYLKLGSPEKAVSFLQHALKLDPSNPEAHQALASSYLAQENFRGAAEEFRQLAAVDPDKSEAWFKLGHEYLELSAHLAYRGAHLYRESAWGHRFLGDLLFQRSRWDEAAQEYRKALNIEPRQPGLHASLGQALLHAGKIEEGEPEFHLELQLDSSNELAWLGLAEVQLTTDRFSAALESVAKVWEISPELLALQREFPNVELSREAAKNSVLGLQPSAEAPAKHFLLAALYGITGESAGADEQWKQFQNDVTSSQKQAPNAEANSDPCRSNRYSACVRWLKAKKIMNDSQRLLLGRTQFALRQYDSAAEALVQVHGATKENAEASYWLSRIYQALGAEAYARLEQSFPDSWRTHQLKAEGYALRQDRDNAAKEYQLALQMHPDNPELHEALGELYLENHSDTDAEKELQHALALDGSRTRVLCLLGRLYVQNHENEKAIPYLQKAFRLQPDLPEASSLLGTAYVRLGQFNDAIPKLQRAAPFDHYGNVHYQLYLAYHKLGQAELAQKALARSQDLRRSSLEHDQAVIMGAPEMDSEPQ